MGYKFHLNMLIELSNKKDRELTEEQKRKIRNILENKEEFIKWYKRMVVEIKEDGDVFKIIKEKYKDKEDYFYPSQIAKEEKDLIKDFEELLKDKWDYVKELKK